MKDFFLNSKIWVFSLSLLVTSGLYGQFSGPTNVEAGSTQAYSVPYAIYSNLTIDIQNGTLLSVSPVFDGSGPPVSMTLNVQWSVSASSGKLSCVAGSLNVTLIPLISVYNVTGGGGYCEGGTGVSVGLDGSQVGVTYQLKRNGNNLGSSKSGTGSSLNFGQQTVSGSYFVVASRSGSSKSMANAVSVSVYAKPSFSVSNSGPVCEGTSLSLTGPSGMSSYSWSGPNGFSSSQRSPTVSSSATPAMAGSYSLTVTNSNGCSNASETVVNVIPAFDCIDENYVISETSRISGVTNPESMIFLNEESKNVGIQYFDGLGRLSQTVGWRQSPQHKDFIQPILYDDFGRNSTSYLPYTGGNDGVFKSNAIDKTTYTNSDQLAFYQDYDNDVIVDSYPIAVTRFEPSPLNRQIEQGAPGESWQIGTGHTVTNAWRLNLSEEVILYTIDGENLMSSGYYHKDELWVTYTTDEEDHTIVEYTDKSGRVLLKDSEGHQTYYIYDIAGQLRWVLPPRNTVSSIPLDSDTLDAFAFNYEYDVYGRMISKKVPGSEPMYMVYDRWDRLVLTQDGNQRNNNQWTFTAYDQLNRPVITGFLTDTRNHTALRSYVMGLTQRSLTCDGSGTHGYNSAAYPFANIGAGGTLGEVLTVSYYDNYQFLALAGFTSEFDYSAVSEVALGASDNMEHVSGLPTGSKVKVLGTSDFILQVSHYDDRYRVIQSTIHNDDLSIVRMSSEYDFTGKVLKTYTDYLSGSFTEPVTETFTYDHADRLMEVTHQIGSANPVTITANEYNELGQLKEKNLHVAGSTALQSVDYQYNIRGWLSKVNEADLASDGSAEYGSRDHFGMQLLYDNAGSYAQYNGNIGQMVWKTSLDEADLQYGYTYDNLNRILTANYGENGTFTSNKFDVSGFSYDANGNIMGLTRRGVNENDANTIIDQLSYTYSGNQLIKVEDGYGETGFKDGVDLSEEYFYDDNGNMIADANKGITNIVYNHLNLPVEVKMDTVTVYYTYDAAGVKLKKVVETPSTTKTTRYQGSMVFEDGVLQFMQHAEGRVMPDGGNWEYQYHLKDHLGNVRLTVTSKQESYTYLATMETELATNEEQLFGNVALTRQTDVLYDHTHLTHGFGNESSRLNAADGKVVGPTLSLYVNAGDTVKVKAYAKYTGIPASTGSPIVIADEVTSGFGLLASGETQSAYQAINTLLGSGSAFLGFSSDPDLPKAYLTYHFFNLEHEYVTSGFAQVTSAADGGFEELSLELQADQKGFVYIYVGNETLDDFNVFFDDLEVNHIYTPIVQKDDYYPFGLTFNSYTSGTENLYKYNGKEEQKETGWYDYGARMYDAALGRFFTQDRFADKYLNYSPYHYTMDNPINAIDINGDSVYHSSVEDAKRAVNNLNSIYRKKYGIDYDLFKVQTREASITKIRGVLDFFFGASTETENVSFVTIDDSKNFDFGQDKQSTGLFAAIMARTNIEAVVTDDPDILAIKGRTVSSREFKVPTALPNFDVNDDTNEWTFGGAWLHELLYHISPVGKEMVDEAGGNDQSSELYRFYLDNGTGKNNHSPGDQQNATLKKQYDRLRLYYEKRKKGK